MAPGRREVNFKERRVAAEGKYGRTEEEERKLKRTLGWRGGAVVHSVHCDWQEVKPVKALL